MTHTTRPLAVVTGASSGIGYELARICAENGHDLIIAADRPEIHEAAGAFRALGSSVEALEVDLSTEDGVGRLVDAVGGRPVAVLMANAGHGLGDAFLEQDFAQVRKTVDTNITGTIDLIHRLGRPMVGRGAGRILVTGSIAGFTPGAYNAVYNATKAFINSFCLAVRSEIAESGVTLTCLMPGATDTGFFERAEMEDTRLGQAPKDDPAKVAQTGYDAMMRGDGDIVYGLKNKIASALANVTPAAFAADQHGKLAKPGSAAG